MSVKLQKGQKISLSKSGAGGGLSRVMIGLGWDEAEKTKKGPFGMSSGGRAIDCDAFAILLTNGKLASSSDVVYFGHKVHGSGAVQHMGDNLTGAGEGDDEQIMIDLSRVPAQYDRIVIAVNIYQAIQRKQDFGMIRNAFIRLVDMSANQEICIYNLSENYGGMIAVLFGEIYRYNGEWKFNPVGSGTMDKSVQEFARKYK